MTFDAADGPAAELDFYVNCSSSYYTLTALGEILDAATQQKLKCSQLFYYTFEKLYYPFSVNEWANCLQPILYEEVVALKPCSGNVHAVWQNWYS